MTPMRLSPSALAAVRQALNEVSVRALIAEQCPDTESALKALRDVSWAVVRAAQLLRTAEREAREAALQQKDAA